MLILFSMLIRQCAIVVAGTCAEMHFTSLMQVALQTWSARPLVVGCPHIMFIVSLSQSVANIHSLRLQMEE